MEVYCNHSFSLSIIASFLLFCSYLGYLLPSRSEWVNRPALGCPLIFDLRSIIKDLTRHWIEFLTTPQAACKDIPLFGLKWVYGPVRLSSNIYKYHVFRNHCDPSLDPTYFIHCVKNSSSYSMIHFIFAFEYLSRIGLDMVCIYIAEETREIPSEGCL